MTPIQHGLLRHALGLDRRKNADRNCLATGEGEDTYAPVTHLCEAGLMYAGAKIPGGLTYYHATEAGVAAAKLEILEYRALHDAVRDHVLKEVARQTQDAAPVAATAPPPATQPYEDEA